MRIAIVLAVLALATSCSNDNGNGGAFGNQCSGDYDRLMGSLCDVLSRCPDVYPLAYSSRDECKAILCWASTCRLDVTDVGGNLIFHITQMVPTVDATSEQACIDWLSTVSCDQLRLTFSGSSSSSSGMMGTPCSNVLGGQTSSGNGGPSECSSQSCADGSFCQYGSTDVDAGVRTCSVCQALPTLGQHCSGQCAAPLYCDDHFNTSSDTCVMPAADGMPCYEQGINQNPCQSGFCNFNTLKCDPNGHDGDPCTNPSDCRNNYCNAQQKCAQRADNGQPCTSSDECKNTDCDPTTHTCGFSVGMQCFTSNECLGYCDTSSDTCQTAKALGVMCNTDEQCQSGFCAETSNTSSGRACAVKCDVKTPCPSGQVCSQFSSCEPPQQNGSDCTGGDQCMSGHCGLMGTCSDPPTLGGACTDSTSCYPIGYCTGGTCHSYKMPGQPCDSYDACLAPYVCLSSKCVPLNLTCAPASAGQMCAYLHVCDDQSYCDAGANFTCKPRHGAGSMCSSDDQCATGLYCAMSKCAAQLAAGSACTADTQCVAGTYCVTGTTGQNGTCTAGPAGQPCDRYRGPFCPDGYACPDTTNRCVAGSAAAGMPCDEFSGPFCDPGLFCDAGMCAARRPLGGQCYEDNQCLSGHCDNQVDLCLTSDMCMAP
jgi:hypothetical protein